MSIVANPLLRGAELAQATAEYITAHPEEWDQNTWGEGSLSCGTRACFGGTACLISGEGFWYTSEDEYQFTDTLHEESFTQTARRVLDLDTEQGEDLFYGDWEGDRDYDDITNRVQNMWAKMVELYGDKITVPEEYKSTIGSGANER